MHLPVCYAERRRDRALVFMPPGEHLGDLRAAILIARRSG